MGHFDEKLNQIEHFFHNFKFEFIIIIVMLSEI